MITLYRRQDFSGFGLFPLPPKSKHDHARTKTEHAHANQTDEHNSAQCVVGTFQIKTTTDQTDTNHTQSTVLPPASVAPAPVARTAQKICLRVKK